MLQHAIALLSLIWPSLVFHLIAYGKSNERRKLLLSLSLGQAALASGLLIASIAGTFRIGIITLITAAIVTIGALFAGKAKVRTSSPIEGKDLIVIAAVFLYFLALQQVSSPYAPDSITQYLPWAKELSTTGKLTQATESSSGMYSPPLAFAYYSYLFLTSGEQLSIPPMAGLWFITAAIGMLWLAAKETRRRLLPELTLLMVLSSFFFVKLGKMVLTEPAIIFFATSSLVWFWHHLKEKDSLSLVIVFSSAMAYSCIKFTGLLFSAALGISILLAQQHRKGRWKTVAIAALCHLPLIALLIRNLVLYQNPFFPWFAAYFPGSLNEAFAAARTIGDLQKVGVISFIGTTLAGFPAIILAAIYLGKNWKKRMEATIIIMYLLSVLFVGVSQWPRLLARYQMQFYGFFALLAAYATITIIQRLRLRERLLRRSINALIILGFIIPIIAFGLQQAGAYHSDYLADRYGYAEQQRAQEAFTIMTQYVDDPRIMGDHAALFTWQGGTYIDDPGQEADFIVQDRKLKEWDPQETALRKALVTSQGNDDLSVFAESKSFITIWEDDDMTIWGDETSVRHIRHYRNEAITAEQG